MGINSDGTATCTNCGATLPGYGVIYGLLISKLDDSGHIDNLIFCYASGCNDKVLRGNLNH